MVEKPELVRVERTLSRTRAGFRARRCQKLKGRERDKKHGFRNIASGQVSDFSARPLIQGNRT